MRTALAGLALACVFTRTAAANDKGADPCAEAATTAWKAVEARGGVVPDIEDDGTQAPPLWWHYPGPRRALEILTAEARDAKAGLYAHVEGPDLEAGDVVVRPAGVGAGSCGRIAVVAGRAEGRWILQDANVPEDGAAPASDDAFFFDGKALRPETSAFRPRVKADSTLGHVRELDRDLTHLERVIAERPPLVAKGAGDAVAHKVHELVDEAWSLMADPAFDLQRRELSGRALALAAALDWPGAAESAAAVLDDVVARAPTHAAPLVARASVYLLAGQVERALTTAEAAAALPDAPARAHYVLGRARLAAGKTEPGLAALRQYLAVEPRDLRASRIVASGGRDPKLAPAPAPPEGLHFEANAEHAAVTSAVGFRVEWPIPWRVVAVVPRGPGEVLLQILTSRVFDDHGETGQGAVTLIVQRPEAGRRVADVLAEMTKEVLPPGKRRALPPLVAGSRHEAYRVKDGDARAGEVTTLEHAGVAYFLSLDAEARAYPKLKDEYAAFVKSLKF
ncbi:MAG TPA: hypothetical protein VHJ20_04860 [Polyangia bacterium]|nr:hypothetical protein [Polyangia bacterium]